MKSQLLKMLKIGLIDYSLDKEEFKVDDFFRQDNFIYS